jgi:glutathione S-transferase
MILAKRSLTMIITITVFERSPDSGKGLARDTRVRWALEEVGQPYEVPFVSFRAMKEPAHLSLHPSGQIPTYEEGDRALFETGAIVFHIAERHAALLAVDGSARTRAITWMLAAVNTVEPPILELGTEGCWRATSLGIRSACPWSRSVSEIHWTNFPLVWVMRLACGAFSAGDPVMVSVLLRLKSSAFWTNSQTWPPISPAANRGPPTSGLSTLNRQFTPEATDRLIEVRPGLEVAIRVFRPVYASRPQALLILCPR